MSAGLEGSWLIQRLDPPRHSPLADAFSFGGGLRNGGLSSEAADLLRECFSFDYMGAAEFEWGAVPKALDVIAAAAGAGDLEAFEIDGPVFVIAPNDWRDEVTERVTAFASPQPPRALERVGLNDVLSPPAWGAPRTAGWLELDNGYFFFTDRSMWANVAALFGLSVEAGAIR